MNRLRFVFVVVVCFTGISNSYANLKIRNFREIVAGFDSIMGPFSGNAAAYLQMVYLNTKDQLPRFGYPQEFSSSVVLATSELSGAYCQKMVEREMALGFAERTFFSEVDFELGPKQFSNYVLRSILEPFSILFWQRELRSKEKEVFSNIVAEFNSDGPELKQETVKLLQTICTLFATSLSHLALN